MKKVNSKSGKKEQGASAGPAFVQADDLSLPVRSPSASHFLPQERGQGVTMTTAIGFNGQLFDSVSRTSLLGNGYRAYSPTMRAFYSPDNLSPFGAGGVSRYHYCNLDPINYSDPSGHSPVGAAIAIIGALSTMTAVVSVGLSLGAWAHRNSDPEYSDYLDDLATGFGIASAVLGVTAIGMAGARSISRSVVSRAARRGSVRTWGTYVRDNRNIKGINFFEDSNRFGPRLNISAHGTYGNGTGHLIGSRSSRIAEILKGPKYYNADDVYGMITKQYGGAPSVDHIRVLACHSADGGASSFGQRLSTLMRKKVTAYAGEVHTTPLEPVIGDMLYVLKNSPGRNYQPVLFRP